MAFSVEMAIQSLSIEINEEGIAVGALNLEGGIQDKALVSIRTTILFQEGAELIHTFFVHLLYYS
jgi:hypothetical protein